MKELLNLFFKKPVNLDYFTHKYSQQKKLDEIHLVYFYMSSYSVQGNMGNVMTTT